MPRLHDYILSADCYMARLLLALLGVAYERRGVDVYPGREHEGEAFRRLNPRGTIPVLEENGRLLGELGDILRHIAMSYDPAGTWLPQKGRGLIERWLNFALTELAVIEQIRLKALTGATGGLDAPRPGALAAMRVLEDRMTERGFDGAIWVVGNAPTIADIALFPYVALSHDAGIGHEDYPAINLWQRRVRKLRGFVTMPGIPDYF